MEVVEENKDEEGLKAEHVIWQPSAARAEHIPDIHRHCPMEHLHW